MSTGAETPAAAPERSESWWRRRPGTTVVATVALALLAYLPSLGSSPGRMPADTKLYLYLEPAALLGRASSTFEREQFAGWVPHQQITYLWPSGPWYRILDIAGLPDWVAHRLWIGTILFCAGTGVFWLGRRLGFTVGTALVGGLVYQLSPYLLPYVSRTSLLLLPWAALGWLVGLTVLACRDETAPAATRWQRWRSPALIALVVATVGSANATALALVAPAPALWLVHVVWMRDVQWRQAVAIAARTVLLCLAASLWWIAMLVVQSRHGAPVLAYSETLEDVSRNATGSEVLRGLGYWLFYVRDPIAPTTTAAEPYLVSTAAIAVSYAVTLVGLVGLVAARWAARGFAALLVLVGIVLAVGVHPLNDPSPLMSLLATDDESGLALALRSSTRAAPLLVLGIALGAAAFVGAWPARLAWRPAHRRSPSPSGARSWSPRALAGTLVVVLVLLNLPALWGLDLVDPAIDRDEDPPAAWVEAADSLGDGTAYRVLQLPGAEFGAFRWGYTVDQPLVALTERPVVTRDLLPLGAGAAMNLLYALDDRVQERWLEAESIAPVSRLLGVDTIWLANDLQFERFRTPRPEVFDASLAAVVGESDLGTITYYGVPEVNLPEVAMLDPTALTRPEVGGAIAPVGLNEIDDPIAIVRA
ncbi:MAG: alpha-(1-_3)-arabinofuranosyltransferase family protein, partial [Acidimicrobiia bacterium]|nr:alpha-(1->3)-arabinofuranosyltransferase family protein [Acidimicrobiia bacterium]